ARTRLHEVSAWQAFATRAYELQFFVRRIPQFLIIAVLAGAGCGQQAAPITDFAALRQRMVTEQLKARGISDERVLNAMNKVPREEFVPADVKTSSYDDQALPIGQGQTISQPYVVAFMTEQLRLTSGDRVLEI